MRHSRGGGTEVKFASPRGAPKMTKPRSDTRRGDSILGAGHGDRTRVGGLGGRSLTTRPNPQMKKPAGFRKGGFYFRGRKNPRHPHYKAGDVIPQALCATPRSARIRPRLRNAGNNSALAS